MKKSYEEKAKNRQYMRGYRVRNLELLQAKEKAYRLANREKVSAAQKLWREANKDALKEASKRYREENKETIRNKHRQIYLNNRAKYIADAAARYHLKSAEINKAHKDAHRRDPRIVMLRAAKTRARKKKVGFSLQLEDIIIPKYCPVLGLLITVGDGFRCEGSPSLDRVDAKGPYARSNCRVISFKANTLKNDGTIEDHERIIAYMKGER